MPSAPLCLQVRREAAGSVRGGRAHVVKGMSAPAAPGHGKGHRPAQASLPPYLLTETSGI